MTRLMQSKGPHHLRHLFKKMLGTALLFFLIPYASATIATPFSGLIGVDYEPNHYLGANTLNSHDVFYVGNNNGVGITNVYAELVQLQAAGFTAVRSYQTYDYPWVEIINQANALGMKVIYEANIPQLPADTSYANSGCPFAPGNQDYIPCAKAVLNSVITNVTPAVFNQTVILVLAGHENYCNQGNLIPPCNGVSNITYLTTAIADLQTTLTTAGVTTPVGSAVVSGNFVTPSQAISNDMVTLVNSYSTGAPLAYDPYPFQWGVPSYAAVWGQPLSTTVQNTNSLAFDYTKVVGSTTPPATPTTVPQPFYTPAGRVLLSAETGWASGCGTVTGYACCPSSCSPTLADAITYYQALYQTATSNFVTTAGYSIGVFAFEAYDEPNKITATGPSAEGYYGLFDSSCNQKAAGLVPSNSLVSPNGCQGFSAGALLTVIGPFSGPYTVALSQTNPTTNNDASIMLSSLGQVGPMASQLWPEFLVFPGATLTIRGNPSCTSTIQSIDGSQHITWAAGGTCNCKNDNSNNCFH